MSSIAAVTTFFLVLVVVALVAATITVGVLAGMVVARHREAARLSATPAVSARSSATPKLAAGRRRTAHQH